MKKILLTIIVSITIFASCSKDSETENETGNFQLNRTNVCYEAPLIAGQHYDSGRLTIVQLGSGNYEVSYEMENGWELDYAHLYIGDCALIPSTKKGNPKVGRFPFKSDNASGNSILTFTINFNEFPNCLCIAAHAEVHKGNQHETAWVDGIDFSGSNWATYFEFCKDSCDR